jgi:hypothetical protein
MLVINRASGKLIGIVALGDLATEHSAEVDRTLSDISTPSSRTAYKRMACGPDRRPALFLRRRSRGRRTGLNRGMGNHALLQ